MAEDLKQMRVRLDTLKTQRAKDEGALELNMKRLKDEFGCKTLDQARALYVKQQKENQQAEAVLDAKGEELDAQLTAMEQAVAGR